MLIINQSAGRVNLLAAIDAKYLSVQSEFTTPSIKNQFPLSVVSLFLNEPRKRDLLSKHKKF